MKRKIRVAVFISGGGTNLQSLIDSAADPEYPAEIALVVSSKRTAYGLERAKAASIPSKVLRKKDFDADAQFVSAAVELLHSHEIDVICLAGYLKLVPEEIVREFRHRILNIHPALLPDFGGEGMYGMRVHEAVLAAKARESGPTVHFVDEIYDHGNILMQSKVPVLEGDTPEKLQRRVLEAEHKLYPQALKKLALDLITTPNS